MYTVQLKQSSGLSKYMNVLEINFYAAAQKLPELREKLKLFTQHFRHTNYIKV